MSCHPQSGVRVGLVSVLLLALGACAGAPDPHPVTPVPSLDLTRYAGRWYELAKYPNIFQTGCLADTSADYRLLADGGVEVVNRCAGRDGSFDQAVGRAERSGGPAQLRVRFAPAWLGWLPLVWGRYWVIDLDADYSLAAVGEPGRDYLWILSRAPAIDDGRYQALLGRLQAQGYDIAKLERTRQTGAETSK